MILRYLIAAVLAYLLGSISPGIIISHRFATDIRTQGSKSTGTTNMIRVMGWKYGLLTFGGDLLKASLAILLGRWLASEYGALLAGLMAVLGHNWPAFYQFRGGKGIACSIAVFLWICPIQALVGGAVAILVIAFTRYVSLGSLTFLFVTAVLAVFTRPFWPVGLWAIALLLLGVYQHRSNIRRLLDGKENKLNLSSAKQ